LCEFRRFPYVVCTLPWISADLQQQSSILPSFFVTFVGLVHRNRMSHILYSVTLLVVEHTVALVVVEHTVALMVVAHTVALVVLFLVTL
jgi:hypothetical protein